MSDSFKTDQQVCFLGTHHSLAHTTYSYTHCLTDTPPHTCTTSTPCFFTLSCITVQADVTARKYNSSKHSTSYYWRCLAQSEYNRFSRVCCALGCSVKYCHSQQQHFPSKSRAHTQRNAPSTRACMMHAHTSHTSINKPYHMHEQTWHMHSNR